MRTTTVYGHNPSDSYAFRTGQFHDGPYIFGDPTVGFTLAQHAARVVNATLQYQRTDIFSSVIHLADRRVVVVETRTLLKVGKFWLFALLFYKGVT